MSTVRILGGGQRDLRGETINGLRIGDYVQRRPLVWEGTCTRCNARSTYPHVELLSGAARCRNSSCGKERLSEYLADSPAKARKREAAAQAERDRHAGEQEQAKIAQAEEQLAKTSRQLGQETRIKLRKRPDDEFQPDPKTTGMRLTAEEAHSFNRAELAAFRKTRPDALLSDRNVETLQGYFDRNGVHLVSARTLAAAYDRLSSFGLLEARPVSQVPQKHAQVSAFQVTPKAVPVELDPAEPGTVMGFDLQTGKSRAYTLHEVNRMSAEAYRVAFRVSRDTFA